MAQDLAAWNILEIYLEPRNTALSNKCAGQGPTSAVGDKTPPPPPALEVQQHRHEKSSQSTCWNYSKLKSQPQHHFLLFLLCYSLVGFWEFIFYNPKPARVFSLTFSASNTVRSSQSTCWTGFKYLLHSVIGAINLYLLFSSCTTQCLVYYAALTVSHSFHLLSYKTLGWVWKHVWNILCNTSRLDVCNSKEYWYSWGVWKSSSLEDCFVQLF